MGKRQWSKPNNLYHQWYAKVWTSTLEVGGDGSHMTTTHYEFTFDLGYIGGLFPGPSHLVLYPDPTTYHKEKRSGEPTRISWASKCFCDSVTQQRSKHFETQVLFWQCLSTGQKLERCGCLLFLTNWNWLQDCPLGFMKTPSGSSSRMKIMYGNPSPTL